VSSRVSPTDKIRAEIDALFGSGRDLAEVIEEVARLGARLLIQTAVEAEVQEFLGRARYQRRAGSTAIDTAVTRAPNPASQRLITELLLWDASMASIAITTSVDRIRPVPSWLRA
jgi:hypothetical protein